MWKALIHYRWGRGRHQRWFWSLVHPSWITSMCREASLCPCRGREVSQLCLMGKGQVVSQKSTRCSKLEVERFLMLLLGCQQVWSLGKHILEAKDLQPRLLRSDRSWTDQRRKQASVHRWQPSSSSLISVWKHWGMSLDEVGRWRPQVAWAATVTEHVAPIQPAVCPSCKGLWSKQLVFLDLPNASPNCLELHSWAVESPQLQSLASTFLYLGAPWWCSGCYCWQSQGFSWLRPSLCIRIGLQGLLLSIHYLKSSLAWGGRSWTHCSTVSR